MSYNPFTLEGKTILVTGASSGIGRETAIQCSKLGAKVIITARNEERLNETLMQMEGGGHRMVLADLTQREKLNNLVESVGCINGLVLCAGQGMLSPILFSNREKYDALFEVDFFAPIELLRLLVKNKKLDKGSSVVVVSSIAGNQTFTVGNAIYGAAKAAIQTTMKYCALEMAPRHIRVNSVELGMVNTPFIRTGDSPISDEQYKADIERYPLKRYGEPQDVAFGIIYLLSDASSWVTGHALVIDGGRTLD